MTCDLSHMYFLAPQSGAFRISAYRDFQSQSQSHPTTSNFRAFKPFYGDLKQPQQTKADQCRPKQVPKVIKAINVINVRR